MSRHGPRVSIVLVTCDAARHLDQQLGALLAQDFDDFEVVVVDNASTDTSVAIAHRRADEDPRVRVLTSSQPRAAGWTQNRCLGAASGEYFKWAIPGEVLDPTYLTRCVETLDRAEDVVLCQSEIGVLDNGALVGHRRWRAVDGDRADERFRAVLLGPFERAPVTGLARSAAMADASKAGPYVASDRLLVAQLALRGKLVAIPEVLCFEQDDAPSDGDDPGRLGSHESIRPDDTTMPSWRRLGQHARAIRAAPASVDERRRAVLALAPRAWKDKADLAVETVSSARGHARRARQAGLSSRSSGPARPSWLPGGTAAARIDIVTWIAMPRTGSTYLGDLLGAHPQIASHGELFNRYGVHASDLDELVDRINEDFGTSFTTFDDPELVRLAHRMPRRFLASVARLSPGKILSFKLFPQHMRWSGIRRVILADRRNLKVALRRNPLDSYISREKARRVGQWSDADTSGVKIVGDVDEFASYVERIERWFSSVDDRLRASGQPRPVVHYEDVVALADEVDRLRYVVDTLRAASPALLLDDIDVATLDTGRVKQDRTRRLEDRIENYDEFVRGLEARDLHRHLGD